SSIGRAGRCANSPGSRPTPSGGADMGHDISPDALQRFWAKVDRRDPEECWPWTAYCHPDGYGRFRLTQGKVYNAHRLALAIASGEPVPPSMDVDHLCRSRSCCNPAHLEATPHR